MRRYVVMVVHNDDTGVQSDCAIISAASEAEAKGHSLADLLGRYPTATHWQTTVFLIPDPWPGET